jgi:fumarate hydratase class II
VLLQPHDEVNLGQSSNDCFPSAMHIAVLQQMQHLLLPALHALQQALLDKAMAWKDLVKIGRTHLQDATPVTLGQEFGGYATQLALCRNSIAQAQVPVVALAIGGTAVGIGLNTHAEFGSRVAALLATQLKLPLH